MRIVSYVFILTVFIVPYAAHAETHIYRNTLQGLGESIWTKDLGPYILEEQMFLPNGHSLRIEKGVFIRLSTTTDWTHFYEINHSIWGNLIINGTQDEPVIFDDVGTVSISSEMADVHHAIFRKTGLKSIDGGVLNLSDSILQGSEVGLTVRSGRVDIQNVDIFQNKIGLQELKGHIEIYRTASGSSYINYLPESILTVRNSRIFNNATYDVIQEGTTTLDAVGNWWGSPNGPNPDKIRGNIVASPWLTEDPSMTCCSNVLFLPGIEASRLYLGTEKIWEPSSNSDVEEMYLDYMGKSINSEIKAGDIVDSAYGLKSIYKSFIAMINGMVADKVMNEWLPIAYDWRQNVEDVASSIVASAEKLATSSKTGKILIVAHSNGGLVAKALVKMLSQKGKSNLIEKIINVAVPEFGTPQAILGMLHGHNQSIALGLITTENTARTFSQNMPGAYGLLPSRKFFENDPLQVFSGVAATYDAMKNFLLSNPFSKASSTDTNIPLLLNPLLLNLAENIHDEIDNWISTTTSIMGWGLPTSSGIRYEKDPHCGIAKKCPLIYEPIATTSGDGTVLVASQSGVAQKNLFINLKKLARETRQKINHSNILESKDVQNIIASEIQGTTTLSNQYISTTEPVDNDKWLTIKLFSPVDLEIFDQNGNTDIPASSYEDYGGVKIAMLPYDDYQIILKGTDTGVFTLRTEISQFGKIIASSTFDDIPVTASMNAELVVATSTSLSIDINGDGITEYTIDSKKSKKDIRKRIRRIIKGKFDQKRHF